MTNEPTSSKPCRHGGFWGVILLLVAGLLVSVGLNLALSAGLAVRGLAQKGTPGGTATDEFPSFTEELSYGSGDVKAVRISLDGVILRGVSGGGLFGEGTDPVEEVLRQIRAARNDRNVRAILFEVNSPGGAVTPSDEIYRALREFRASRSDRRIVVHVRDLCASGGYYVAVAADRIVSEPTAIVGSIGVIMEALNWHAMADKIGIGATTIKSGENKDLMNPFRPVNPENVKILQAMVDDAYRRFSAIVADGRKMSPEQLAPLADGRIFSAPAALEAGLIDELGGWEEATRALATLCETDAVRLVRYTDGRTFFEKMFSVRTPEHPLARWTDALPSAHPRMMYIWRP
jgi:protease IV